MAREAIKADLAIIGAGSAGLSAAAGAAQLGLSVILFEKGEMGGDCLNHGCIPSKALIAAAARAHQLRRGETLGVGSRGADVDFASVMAHVRRVIEQIAPTDSQARFESLGVRVIREAAWFCGPDSVESDSVRVVARKVLVATGSRPSIPPIPGLKDSPYLTNETVFGLEQLPEHLIVLGAGPIGVELGQAFRRLGAAVTVVEARSILGKEDSAAAAVVAAQLRADGVELIEGASVIGVEPGPILNLRGAWGERRIAGSHLLVATGRAPDLGGLDLGAAGIEAVRDGVKTDRTLQSTNRRVFAIGDAAGQGQYTHLASVQAALFIRRGLFALPVDAKALAVPRVTYTDPELAGIGLTEAEARKIHGEDVKVVRIDFDDNDRARTQGDTRGFGKLVTTRRGRILGVVLVGARAGDEIGLWALAMSAKLPLRAVAGMIAPYPTRGEISKRLAGQWYAPRLFSPGARRLVAVLKRIV